MKAREKNGGLQIPPLWKWNNSLSLSFYSSIGYSTGIVIKEQKDRKEYIEDFYANHPDAPRPMARFASTSSEGGSASASSVDKRAKSLPNVLEGSGGNGGLTSRSRARSLTVKNSSTSGGSTKHRGPRSHSLHSRSSSLRRTKSAAASSASSASARRPARSTDNLLA